MRAQALRIGRATAGPRRSCWASLKIVGRPAGPAPQGWAAANVHTWAPGPTSRQYLILMWGSSLKQGATPEIQSLQDLSREQLREISHKLLQLRSPGCRGV